MDQITFSYTSSSSSSNDHPPKTFRSSRLSYHNSLHSVRKAIQKPTTKHFIAPLPPAPPKIYKVDSSNFKQTVHALTSDAKFQKSPSGRRLKDIAPPPLVLSTVPKPSLFPKPPPPSDGGGMASPLSALTLSPDFCKFLNETLDTTRFKTKSSPVIDYFGGLSPLGFNMSPAPCSYDPSGIALMSPLGFSLSPSSLSWCSSLLLSPGTLSGFTQSVVL